MGAYEDATHAAVEAAIFDLMESSEPGVWYEATDTWDDTPHSIQAAVNACLRAKLISMEAAQDGRFRCKLTAAGEVLRLDRPGIMEAVYEGRNATPVIGRWQRRAATPDPGNAVLDEALVRVLASCLGTWQAFDQAAANSVDNEAIKTLQRAGLIDCRLVVSCTQDGKPETLKLPFVISGPIATEVMDQAATEHLVNSAPPTWFPGGKADGAIRRFREGIVAIRRNTQGETAIAQIAAGEKESICASIRRRGMLGSREPVPVTIRAEACIVEFQSAATSDLPEPESAEPSSMTWEEVAERLETLRSQGEAFKSQPKYAKLFDCSPSTVNKAIDKTPSLHGWANKAPSPKPVAFDQAVAHTPQRREPDPADVFEPADVEAVLARLLEEAKPEERAKLHELTADQKRELAVLVANDPERSNRVWRKKR